MSAQGVGGELRVGYQLAATLGAWRLDVELPGWVVRPTYVYRNPYWLTQRPLRLKLVIGGLHWNWSNVELGPDGTILVSSRPEEGIVNGS